MKKTFFIALFIVILIFASCADADIYYGLSENNSFICNYNLLIKDNDIESRNFAQNISEYWHSLGFDTSTSKSNDSISITGSRTRNYESILSAANAFSNALSASDSLFTKVYFEYNPSLEKDVLNLEATISLEDIIRQSNLQDIPQSQLEELLASAQNGNYSLSIELPGNVTQTNADLQNGNVCIWNLEYGHETFISISSELVNTEDINEYNKVNSSLTNTELVFKILFAAAGLIALVILVLVIVFIIRKARR